MYRKINYIDNNKSETIKQVTDGKVRYIENYFYYGLTVNVQEDKLYR